MDWAAIVFGLLLGFALICGIWWLNRKPKTVEVMRAVTGDIVCDAACDDLYAFDPTPTGQACAHNYCHNALGPRCCDPSNPNSCTRQSWERYLDECDGDCRAACEAYDTLADACAHATCPPQLGEGYCCRTGSLEQCATDVQAQYALAAECWPGDGALEVCKTGCDKLVEPCKVGACIESRTECAPCSAEITNCTDAELATTLNKCDGVLTELPYGPWSAITTNEFTFLSWGGRGDFITTPVAQYWSPRMVGGNDEKRVRCIVMFTVMDWQEGEQFGTVLYQYGMQEVLPNGNYSIYTDVSNESCNYITSPTSTKVTIRQEEEYQTWYTKFEFQRALDETFIVPTVGVRYGFSIERADGTRKNGDGCTNLR